MPRSVPPEPKADAAARGAWQSAGGALRRFAPAIGLLLFAAALWVLQREVAGLHEHEVFGYLRALPRSHVALALVFVAASYFLLTLYDALAMRYVGQRLRFRQIAFASFVSYTFSHNIGLPLVTGGGVRYRLYSAWGLSGFEIARVVLFTSGTLWVGFGGLAGVLFLLDPASVPDTLPLSRGTLHPFGALLLALLAAYFTLVVVRRAPMRLRSLEVTLPSPPVAVGQLVLAAADWFCSAAVLLPLLWSAGPVPILHVLTVFLFAQAAGLISQVPGGLGVFESVIVAFLSPSLPVASVLAALLAYRVLYYLLPFALASLLLGAHELRSRRRGVQLPRWVAAVVPHILALNTFVAGAILLLSGTTPAVGERLAWLRRLLPLPVIEVSHFLGSLLGAALLVLARALQLRIEAAWFLTALLLGGGAVLSLLKGFDYEEATILGIMLAALLPCRSRFYRRASLLSPRLSAGWIAAVVVVLASSVWLGLFAFRHVEYSHDLWWRVAYHGNASRFLRATVGVAAFLLVVAVAKLLRPAPAVHAVPDAPDLADAERIATASPRTTAYLALTGDKSLLFSPSRDCFLMYAVRGRSWVALGDPVGAAPDPRELLWAFRELCDRHGGWTVFYQVDAAGLAAYVDLGLTFVKLGEEARVPLEPFGLEGGGRKALRKSVRRVEEAGFAFRVLPAAEVPARMPELQRVSDRWLAARKLNERGFSLGTFSAPYLARFPAAVLVKEERIVAFANVWPGGGKEELSIDLMRYEPGQEGLMDSLLVHLMLWGQAEGYRWFNLGMAPWSGMPEGALAPLWSRLGAFVFQYGGDFYNFAGLRAYKEKFDPVWTPKYLASPGGIALPLILADIGRLIARGPPP